MNRILVVENSEQMSQVFCDYLRAHECDVFQASDATQGLIQAGTNDYDFIIVSNKVPGMAPREFIESISRLSPKAEIICVAYSWTNLTGQNIKRLPIPVVLSDLWTIISENQVSA